MSDLMFPKTGKPKKKPARKALTPLRKFAKGQDCTLRLPSICNFNPETVVLCHVKPKGFGAMGSKPSDLHAVHACSSCHSFIDGEYVKHNWSREQVESEIFRALSETLARALIADLVKID